MAKADFEGCSVIKIRRFLMGWQRWAILGALLPTQLLAQSCATVRPNWNPGSGPVTAWDEALYLFTSPMGIVCLGAFALAVLTLRNTWLLAAGAGSAALGLLLYSTNLTADPFEITQDAVAEGCVGPTSTAVAICAVICLICAGLFALKRRLKGRQ
jgi:hypothetical protein